MLCPSHNSLKFPRERSKFRKSAITNHPLSADSTQMYNLLFSLICFLMFRFYYLCELIICLMTDCRASTELDFWKASPNGKLDWVFCGSALSSEEKVIFRLG